MKSTWKPLDKSLESGKINKATRNNLPETVYAFPEKKIAPLTDKSHTVNAIARFCAIKNVTDEEKELAIVNIRTTGNYYGCGSKVTTFRDVCEKKK